MFNTIFPKIHKEGYKFLAISILLTFIVLFLSKFLGLIFILISIWVYYFFRDPERVIINDDNFLVSPADGEVIKVEEVEGPRELGLENKKFNKIKILASGEIKKKIDLNAHFVSKKAEEKLKKIGGTVDLVK